MLGVRFLAFAVASCRNFATKSASKIKRIPKTKKSEPGNPKCRINWTDEQRQVISAVCEGKSVFVTGSAGTGKTILLKRVIYSLRRYHGPSAVYVTASTGVAACAIGGLTLHSFAGIRTHTADRKTLLQMVLMDPEKLKRWKNVESLVIDEISMVSAELFDNLEYIARMTRENDKIWGGIRLVVTGDFFQLPPIIDKKTDSGKEYAFEAECWDASFDIQVELTSIFRQSDSLFINMLQRMRKGENNPEDLELLQQSCSETRDPSVVRLCPLNEDVRRLNAEKLEELCNELVTYMALDSGEGQWRKQLKQGIAPDIIDLCKGARVMLIKNLNTSCGLVNGATGTLVEFRSLKKSDVTDICYDDLLPVVKFDSGKTLVIRPRTWEIMDGDSVVASRKQVPLILAWAISIHKSQGVTLDKLQVDLSRAFGYGMTYVALSRVRSLQGLHLSNFRPNVKAHPKVLEFYKRFSVRQVEEGDDCGYKGMEEEGYTKEHFSDYENPVRSVQE